MSLRDKGKDADPPVAKGPDSQLDSGSTTTHNQRPPFLVAGVGASAGGLEALRNLLGGFPANAPLALVVVQHLAPDHPSILPELLGRTTKLVVSAAEDALRIEIGHVYVIPPDARMTVSDGHLRIRPAPPQRDPEGAVDTLFKSMAADYEDRAIGVVLSGSASDGAAGIRQIKCAGGIALIQSPEEATVDGMPRAAIATGAVDAILPAGEIGSRLLQLAMQAPFHGDGATESALTEETTLLDGVFHLLRRSGGIDFRGYKIATVKRRIERRIALHRLLGLSDYVELLKRDPSELGRLQEELLIHVTSFFREPAAFDVLETEVFPRLLATHNADTPIRFWVPGCSTGEEVYSLALVLFEFLSARSVNVPVQIFGTDVSEATIETARSGIYPVAIASEISPKRMRRFFTAIDGRYRVNKEVRDLCVFARQDVTRDPPFSQLDLIVCRNLLIYLKQATQRKVIGVFHYALRPTGALMLGRSESIIGEDSLFSVIHKKAQLYAKKPGGTATQRLGFFASVPAPLERATTAVGPPVRTPVPWDGQNDATRFLLERYAPPSVLIDIDGRLLRSRGGAGSFLELPAGEMTVDILRLARPGLLPALRGALKEARSNGSGATKTGAGVVVDGTPCDVTVRVVPLGNGEGRQFLVLFERGGTTAAKSHRQRRTAPVATPVESAKVLQHELDETRHQLQGIIDDLGGANEELQSANEEILSSNEELQSTNEELDTAKEELQSTNEELNTLNDELTSRNLELGHANSDLLNLLASIQIPIVMVTRDQRIRRFTPSAEKTLNIIQSDMGRPIGHLKPNFVCPNLESLIAEVIETMTMHECEVEGVDGRLFTMQIRPYKNVDNKIDGAVVVMFDISTLEEQAAALEVATATGEALMSTIQDPILMLSSDFHVLKTNEAFLKTFRMVRSETEGRFLFDLGDRQWDIRDLRRQLEEVLPQKKNFEGFAMVHDFPLIGRKALRLDARRIESGRRRQGVILLLMREATGHEP